MTNSALFLVWPWASKTPHRNSAFGSGAVPSAFSRNGGLAVACAPDKFAWFSLIVPSIPAKSFATVGIEFYLIEAVSPRATMSK